MNYVPPILPASTAAPANDRDVARAMRVVRHSALRIVLLIVWLTVTIFGAGLNAMTSSASVPASASELSPT